MKTFILNELREIAKKMNFKLTEFRTAPEVDSLNSTLEEVASQSDKIDSVCLPLDSFLVSNANTISDKLKKEGLPSIGAQKDYIDAGTLMGLVPDYYKLGQEAALILNKCEKGEKLENIPVVTEDNPKMIVNRTTKNFFKIEIPSELSTQVVYVE